MTELNQKQEEDLDALARMVHTGMLTRASGIRAWRKIIEPDNDHFEKVLDRRIALLYPPKADDQPGLPLVKDDKK